MDIICLPISVDWKYKVAEKETTHVKTAAPQTCATVSHHCIALSQYILTIIKH